MTASSPWISQRQLSHTGAVKTADEKGAAWTVTAKVHSTNYVPRAKRSMPTSSYRPGPVPVHFQEIEASNGGMRVVLPLGQLPGPHCSYGVGVDVIGASDSLRIPPACWILLRQTFFFARTARSSWLVKLSFRRASSP
jgi:hypothetical protein